jgi:hypothetical protein
MAGQRSIDTLTLHRMNLLECKTFEEYRDAHVAYIDMLIENIAADIQKEESVQRWIAVTAVKTEEVQP